MTRQSHEGSELTEVVLLALGALVGIWLATAELAALIFGEHHFLPQASGVVLGLVGMFRHASDPRRGWPTADRADLPGAVPFYIVLVFVLALVGTGVWGVVRLWRRLPGGSGAGSRRKPRLGADPRARLGLAADMAPLVVDGPHPGRLVLGRLLEGRKRGPLLATEDEGDGAHLSKVRGKNGPSRGGRASLIVIGPSRSGKTSGLAIPAILEWDGPVVALSVKDDLLASTFRRRCHVGAVRVFDPRRSLPEGGNYPFACWTPLRRCGTLAGAARAAKALVDSQPSGGDQHQYWADRASQLLAPYLLAATTAGLSMSDVVRWVDEQDGVSKTKNPEDEPPSEVEMMLEGTESEDATIALRRARSIWGLVPATRDGVFSTAAAVVSPWLDPEVAASAASPDITMDWLLSGQNTLYAVAPAHHQSELEPVFVGLIQDLLDDAFEAAQRSGGVLPRRVLIVLDEAANIAPLKDLPRYASTTSGIGITLVTIFQDAAQIRTRWKDSAATVMNNHVAKMALSGISDKDTLELLSTLLGEEEYAQTSKSTQSSGGSSTSESTAIRRLVPADLVRRIPNGQALLVYGSLLPAHLALRPWYRDSALKALAEPAPVKGTLVDDHPAPAPKRPAASRASLPPPGSDC